MPYPEKGGSGGAGFSLGPVDNIFGNVSGNASANPLLVTPSTNLAAAISVRDAYFTANPSNLATYDTDGNENLGIILYYTDSGTNITQPQTRIGGEWRNNAAIIAIQGLAGNAATVANLSERHIGMRVGNELVDSGIEVEESGTIRIPGQTLGIEDLLEISEGIGFLLLHNTESNINYIVIDAALSETTGSARPRQFVINGETITQVDYQPDKSQQITTNPLAPVYSTTVDGATFFVGFETFAAMNNVKVRILDATTNTPFKYIPSKLVWDNDSSSGLNFRQGVNKFNFFSNEEDDPANGLFNVGNSPLIFTKDRQLKIEIKADSVAFLGDSTGLPFFSGKTGLGTFTDLAYLNDTISSAANTIENGELTTTLTTVGGIEIATTPVTLPSGGGGTPTNVLDESVVVAGTEFTGLLNNVSNQEQVNQRLDSTGLGAQPISFTGSFFCNYGVNGNQGQWSGGRQTVEMVSERGQPNGRYTFEVPDPDELGSMFDDLAAAGLSEVYTLTIANQAGSSSSITRNSLTVTRPSISVGGFIQTTLAQGTSVTYRIERIGGTINSWERLGVQQSSDPVATFGEVVIQSLSWNNGDGSLLPSGDAVLKGYAFPVIDSNPNDGTLRQGLLDTGVSDRLIYDGDYVVWTADAFTSWADGDNWFVLERDSLQRMSREMSNFLAQSSEIDNRVDIGFVSAMNADALVWLSENPLTEAPFLNPSTDTNNPRSGDDYRYIGGQENRNAQLQFQFGQTRPDSYLTLCLTPSFVAAHNRGDIFIRIVDFDTRQVIQNLGALSGNFTQKDDVTFGNSTCNHFVYNTTGDVNSQSSINYPSLATIEIVLTQVQQHFRLNPNTVDVTQNVNGLTEQQLSAEVQAKLNEVPKDDSGRFAEIEDRLMRYTTLSHQSPEIDARFYSDDGTGAYPSDLSQFTQVSSSNPRYTATNTVIFIAVPEPHSFVLKNITADTVVALDGNESTVDVIESFNVSGVTYFVYKVTGIISGHVFEVERISTERVIQERHDILNNAEAIAALEAKTDTPQLPATVDDEDNITFEATDFNKQLAGVTNTTQTVFFEKGPVKGGGGIKQSKPLKETEAELRNKLVYIPAGTSYINQAYLTAFDGSTGRDLIVYRDGQFYAQVFVAAIPSGTSQHDVYPAPSNKVSGVGIWHTIPALTLVNGVPTPESDELFYTRNNATSSTPLTTLYRGHANGNLFGSGTDTLNGYGGGVEVDSSFTLNDGSEQVDAENRYYPSFQGGDPELRISETARVFQGLPTINDIQVLPHWTETRTVPATPATVREVPIEFEHDGAQVFAIRPSDSNTLVLVGDRQEIDTGFTYSTLFGASEAGHLIVPVETAEFYDYQDFTPINTTVTQLENQAANPNDGLFNKVHTHQSVVNFTTQVHAKDGAGNTVNLAEEVILQSSNGTRYKLIVSDAGVVGTTTTGVTQ